MPDPNTANIDPFFEETTLILTCDVLEPGDGKAYDRDPRSIAKRAEAYLKASGLGDTAFFGPEPEFFIFDDVRWGTDMSGCVRQDRRVRSAVEHRQEDRRRQQGPPSHHQGRLLPRAPGRQHAGHARRDVPDPRIAGHPGRSVPPRSGGRRPERDRHQVQHAGAARRLDPAAEVRDPERRQRLRQDRHLHAQAHRRRQRLGHARAPVGLEGRQEPVRRRRLRRPVASSRCTTSAASSSTPAR